MLIMSDDQIIPQAPPKNWPNIHKNSFKPFPFCVGSRKLHIDTFAAILTRSYAPAWECIWILNHGQDSPQYHRTTLDLCSNTRGQRQYLSDHSHAGAWERDQHSLFGCVRAEKCQKQRLLIRTKAI
jgi:hypothetical protein